MTPSPYDIDALQTGAPDPRVRWPVSHVELGALNRDLQNMVVSLARELHGGALHDTYAAGCWLLLTNLLTICNAWLVAERSRHCGIEFRFSGLAVARQFLNGQRQPDDVFLARLRDYLDKALKRHCLAIKRFICDIRDNV